MAHANQIRLLFFQTKLLFFSSESINVKQFQLLKQFIRAINCCCCQREIVHNCFMPHACCWHPPATSVPCNKTKIHFLFGVLLAATNINCSCCANTNIATGFQWFEINILNEKSKVNSSVRA